VFCHQEVGSTNAHFTMTFIEIQHFSRFIFFFAPSSLFAAIVASYYVGIS